MPSPNTNQIYHAIAAHAAAFAAFHEIADCTDETLAGKQGRTVSQADRDLWEKRDGAERRTRLALCSCPTFGTAQLRAKAAYLQAIGSAQVELQEEDYEALLASLAGHKSYPLAA